MRVSLLLFFLFCFSTCEKFDFFVNSVGIQPLDNTSSCTEISNPCSLTYIVDTKLGSFTSGSEVTFFFIDGSYDFRTSEFEINCENIELIIVKGSSPTKLELFSSTQSDTPIFTFTTQTPNQLLSIYIEDLQIDDLERPIFYYKEKLSISFSNVYIIEIDSPIIDERCAKIVSFSLLDIFMKDTVKQELYNSESTFNTMYITMTNVTCTFTSSRDHLLYFFYVLDNSKVDVKINGLYSLYGGLAIQSKKDVRFDMKNSEMDGTRSRIIFISITSESKGSLIMNIHNSIFNDISTPLAGIMIDSSLNENIINITECTFERNVAPAGTIDMTLTTQQGTFIFNSIANRYLKNGFNSFDFSSLISFETKDDPSMNLELEFHFMADYFEGNKNEKGLFRIYPSSKNVVLITFTDVQFISNVAAYDALLSFNDYEFLDVQIRNCNFTHNEVKRGILFFEREDLLLNGIVIDGSLRLSISHSHFEDISQVIEGQRIMSGGGVINVEKYHNNDPITTFIEVTYSTFKNIRCASGCVFSNYYSANKIEGIKWNTMTLTNSFIDNVDSNIGPGGAFELYCTKMNIIESTFFKNNALNIGNGTGGSIYAYKSDITIGRDNIFMYNEAMVMGGAISMENSDVEIDSTTKIQHSKSGYGGGLFFMSSKSNLLKVNCEISNCKSNTNGGALYISGHIPIVDIDRNKMNNNIPNDVGSDPVAITFTKTKFECKININQYKCIIDKSSIILKDMFGQTISHTSKETFNIQIILLNQKSIQKIKEIKNDLFFFIPTSLVTNEDVKGEIYINNLKYDLQFHFHIDKKIDTSNYIWIIIGIVIVFIIMMCIILMTCTIIVIFASKMKERGTKISDGDMYLKMVDEQ